MLNSPTSLLASKDRQAVQDEAAGNIAPLQQTPREFVRDPVMLEFLGLPDAGRLLKCFVLFDLKSGELTHQDIGQMDMYVRMMDEQRRGEDDNPTVGIILCAAKDASVVRYSVLHENEQLFASKYKLILPSEEELRLELEKERQWLDEQLKPDREAP